MFEWPSITAHWDRKNSENVYEFTFQVLWIDADWDPLYATLSVVDLNGKKCKERANNLIWFRFQF